MTKLRLPIDGVFIFMEIWKDIPGYEGLYQVSNLGIVKSLSRKVCNHQGCHISKEKIMTQQYLKKYKRVVLNGKSFMVHQLVAMAFLGHKPCGHTLVIDHINDDASDNRLENLQIVTQRFNSYKTQGKGTSKYKGVGWSIEKNKWRSYIRINGFMKHLGYFNCEEEAHKVYQNKLKELEC